MAATNRNGGTQAVIMYVCGAWLASALLLWRDLVKDVKCNGRVSELGAREGLALALAAVPLLLFVAVVGWGVKWRSKAS